MWPACRVLSFDADAQSGNMNVCKVPIYARQLVQIEHPARNCSIEHMKKRLGPLVVRGAGGQGAAGPRIILMNFERAVDRVPYPAFFLFRGEVQVVPRRIWYIIEK